MTGTAPVRVLGAGFEIGIAIEIVILIVIAPRRHTVYVVGMSTLRHMLLLLVLGAGAAHAQSVDLLYRQHCASCHGPNLEGALASPLNDGAWGFGDTDAEIARNIAEGIPEMSVAGFRDTLTPEHIRALVIYLREAENEERLREEPPPRARRGQPVVTTHARFTLETVTDDLDTPWGLAFLPDGRMLVTECDGRLRVIDADGRLDPEPVSGLPPVIRHGQGGLMDVAVHPDYAKNGWIYLALADGERGEGRPKTHTAIQRGRLRDGAWTDAEWIFRVDPAFYSASTVHFGSRIVFRDGYVFFVIGERGGLDIAQDLARPEGKIFRLFDDGRVPPDNPFVDTPGALPGIWSYGHRNPQGLVFNRDGRLYATEHGPRGGDELNVIKPGANYGWPVITHGMNYNGTPMTGLTEKDGMEQPVVHWTPSIAACGLAEYRGAAFPDWEGDLFAGGLRSEELRRLRLRDGKVIEQEIVLKGSGRIRDVKLGPDGHLYLALNNPDRIVRLQPR